MHRLRNGIGLPAAALAAAIALAGCSSSSNTTAQKSGGRLTAADFSPDAAHEPAAISTPSTPAALPTAQTQPPPPPAPPDKPAKPSPEVTGPIAASEGILDVTAVPGEPQKPIGPMPDQVGPAVLVDEKVGDINGRPVFASKFFEEMADHLRANAAEYARQGYVMVEVDADHPHVKATWREAAKFEIDRKLLSEVVDELLRAEAIAGFTPEQKHGFLAYMESISKKMESENMGSRSAANQKLQSQGGLEQYLKSREEMELVNYQLELKLRRRINISWREIRLEYARELEEWEAKRTIPFRLVDIRADDKAGIEKFKQGLAAGTPFKDLASEPYNLNKPETGGLEAINPHKPEFFGPELDAAAKGLAEGETVGPIANGRYLAWLHREPDPPHLPPLYSAQTEIQNTLWKKRFTAERNRYLEHLRGKTTMTSLDEMSQRLLEIAQERYFPKKPG
jgi:hypothetical protein